MPFKYDAAGNIATQEVNGAKLPIFVHGDGKEAPVDFEQTLGTISRLNGEAKTHREAKEAAEGKLAAFKDIPDPAAAIKALATVKNLNDKQLVDAGEVERIRTEAVKAVEQQYAPFKAKAEELQAALDSHLVGGAFARSKFIAEKFAAKGPAAVEIAQALFASRLKVEGGKVVGYDAQGNKLYSRARPGELADADEAIEMMVDAYPHKASLLAGTGSSGGGSQGGGGGGGGKKTYTRAQFDALSPADKVVAAKDAVITD